MATYIYQDEKWPNFGWRAEAIADQLAKVSRHQGRLVGRMEAMASRSERRRCSRR